MVLWCAVVGRLRSSNAGITSQPIIIGPHVYGAVPALLMSDAELHRDGEVSPLFFLPVARCDFGASK